MLQRSLYAIVVCLLLSTFAHAGIRATFDHKQFLIPGEGAFLETLLSFDGKTLSWAIVDEQNVQSTVEATIVVLRNGEVVDFKKNRISSPVQPNGKYVDFIDVQRFLLPPGSYQLDIELVDLNDETTEKVTLSRTIEISLKQNEPGISSVTFVQAYAKSKQPNELTKSGYDLLPLVSDFFPRDAKKVVFYTELYNTDQVFGEEGKFLLSYAVWNDKGAIETTRKYFRKDAAPVIPLLETLDLTTLQEGRYQLVIEIKNKENEEIKSEAIGFFRSGESEAPFTALTQDYVTKPGLAFHNPDSILDYVSCIYPIAMNVEQGTIRNLETDGSQETLLTYFESFWMNRAPDNPVESWLEYRKEVWKVEDMFATPVRKGYDTDRGRIWLQYGEPNTRITRYNETEVFPYEIWHYYKISRFNDKRFLFYSRTVVNYDFELLHSDMPGEVQNENWPHIMRTKNNDLRPTDTQLNRMNPRDTYSRDELEDLFYNPR